MGVFCNHSGVRILLCLCRIPAIAANFVAGMKQTAENVDDGMAFNLFERPAIARNDEVLSLLSKTDRNLATRVANGRFACPELEF